MELKVENKIIAGFAISLLVVTAITALSFKLFSNLVENSEWVDHTHKVQGRLERLNSYLIDAEAGKRGFLITGEDSYLIIYQNKLGETEELLMEIKKLTTDNNRQQEKLNLMREVIDVKIKAAQKTINLHRQWGPDAAKQTFLLEGRKDSLDKLRKVIKTMYEHEEELLELRLESQRKSLRGNKASLSVIVLLLFLALIVVYYIIRRDLEERKTTHLLLKESRDAAEKANRAKGEFLANMSHEIRTPMNAILGMTDLLQDTRLSPAQKKYIDVLSRAGESLLTVINDILDFSKIESGQLRLDMADFNIREVIRDVTDILAVTAKKKGLALLVNIEEDVPDLVRGDEHHLKQVFYNLIGNAIKFTEKGEVKVCLATEKGIPDVEGYPLRFSISDTGIGISKENQKAIFERFTQADRSTTRRFGGTGLGTSIARGIVELMSGRIWVESEEGKGSTFNFTALFALPDGDKRSVLPNGDKTDKETKPPGKPGDAKSLNILLAEDTEDNRLLLQCYFKKTPHTLDIAENGEEAVNMFKTNRYDMVLMDMEMPVMDGYSATGEIRRWETETGRKRTPVIALTAHAMKEHIQKSIDAGCSGHANKPIKKETLMNIISEYGS